MENHGMNGSELGELQNTQPVIGLLGVFWDWAAMVTQDEDVSQISFSCGELQSPIGFDAQANVVTDLVSAENVDGLVVWSDYIGHYVTVEEIEALCRQYGDLPIVSIGLVEDIPSVLIDNYQGVYDEVAHLIDVHGYRRIACIRGPEGNAEADQRYRAYVDALAAKGLPLDQALVVPGGFRGSSGVEPMETLLDDRAVPFDALVAPTDDVAITVMKVLEERGIRVPDDVAVVGFDDQGEHFKLPITSVRAQWREATVQAVKMILALLRGKQVPERVVLPSKLVVRQSCGCPSSAVMLAGTSVAVRPIEPLDEISKERKEEILSGMRAVLAGTENRDAARIMRLYYGSEKSPAETPLDASWAERLLDGFVSQLRGRSPDAFLSSLEAILGRVAERGGDVLAWQEVLSALRTHALPHAVNAKDLAQIEGLLQQGRVLIGEVAQQMQVSLMEEVSQQVRILRRVGSRLITSFDLDDLADTLSEELPRLGIGRCYLSLYENPNDPMEWARLILAYDPKGRLDIGMDQSERRFPTRQLIPEDLFPEERVQLVVEPLYFRDEQIGILVLDPGRPGETMYGGLAGQVSSALKGALLAQQLDERSAAFQDANYALQRRAIQLEASAEVGRAITSIFDVNQLLRRTVDLIRDRFDFYHAGIFLLDDAGEWAVLREATGEAGAKMKAQNHKLAVDEHSMVGWTALHRQPRLALYAGEDEVRFANPLLPHTRSEMTLPLMVGGQVVGVLNVQSTEEAAFDLDDVRTLQSMADQIAVALENARRVSDEAALLEATSPIYRASRHLTTAATTVEVADAIIASVAETGADGCIVVEFEFSHEGEPSALLYLGVWRKDREPQFQKGQRLSVLDSPFPLDMVSKLWVVTNVDEDQRLPQSARQIFQETEARALVNIPLRSGERVIGQVVVFRATPGAFSDADLRLYEVLSDQAAVALERAQLMEEAQRRAEREQNTLQIVDRVRRAVDVEQVIQVAAEQLSNTMEVPHVSIELDVSSLKRR